MTRTPHQSFVTVGDLIAAAFDCANMITSDEDQAAHLAAGIIARRFARAHRPDIARGLRDLVASKRGAPRERPTYAHAA